VTGGACSLRLYIFPTSDGITKAITGESRIEDAAEALARVLSHLLLGLVDPVPAVEAERDDEHENPEGDSAGLAGRSGAGGDAHRSLLGRVETTESRLRTRVKPSFENAPGLMKVLATRRYPGSAFDELPDVEVLSLASLERSRADVEAVVVANERVPLDLLPSLRIVANFGVGYDRIDVASCAARGVVVTNTPGVLDDATADLAFALILATRRQVVEGDRFVRSGAWSGSWSDGRLADDVSGSTLGILGLGRIGSAVAQRARGFDLRVLYAQRRPVETELGEFRQLDALFREADIVTIHVPLTAETAGLVDARRLALLHDGACLVNTARGEIVDEQALVAELVSGRIRAGLDVFAHEPEVPLELLELSNVVLTPHLGSATRQTREAMTRLVVDNVLAVQRGEPPLTPVRA
jgi:glyoxylate reductase